MLIERAQSYSPARCCSRAACWETSRRLIAVTGGKRPPNCRCHSRSRSPRDSLPSWESPFPFGSTVGRPCQEGQGSPRSGDGTINTGHDTPAPAQPLLKHASGH